MYIRFYNGRKTVDEQMQNWGFDGPIVGPINIIWTYGNIRLISEDGVENIDLTIEEGCIKLREQELYGDFEVIDNDSIYIILTDRNKILNIQNFKRQYDQTYS